MEFSKIRSASITALCSLLISLFCFTPAFADNRGASMEISPVTKSIKLTPGLSYSDSMMVKNIGTTPLNFSMQVAPYQVTNGDYNPLYTTNNNWTQITNWITTSQDTYILEPGASQDINYTIDVPLDVPSGGQFAVLLATSDDGTKNSDMVKVVSNIGMIISAEVSGDTREEGEILSKDIPGFLLQPPIVANFSLSNTGNINATATCTMRITNFFNGSEAYSNVDSSQKFVVMPDTIRNGSLSWDSSPFLGVFRVNLAIEYLNDTANYSKLVILCPLWFIVLFASIITLALIIIVFKFKKRHYRSTKKKFSF